MKLLRPLSLLYGWVTGARSHLYQTQVLSSQGVSVPLFVVGNITAGGTGKTPFVHYLASLFKEKNKKVGIVSRGYKGNYKNVVCVDPSLPRCSEIFGDEPVLLKLKNQKTPVYLSRHRWQACQTLLKNESAVDAILCDDGFQHQALQRDFNIVLIDCTEPLDNYRLLPEGRLREPLKGLLRAHFIVFTKCNWVSEKKVQETVNLIRPYFSLNDQNHAFANYESSFPLELNKRENKVLLLSSIAKPEVFKTTVETNGQLTISQQLVFADHYKYTKKDIDYILHEYEKCGADFILTTEKDEVKLTDFPQIIDKIKTVVLTVKLSQGEESLKNEICKIISSKVH